MQWRHCEAPLAAQAIQKYKRIELINWFMEQLEYKRMNQLVYEAVGLMEQLVYGAIGLWSNWFMEQLVYG